MDIRALWYFLAAASAGGISAGARRLGLAQSTLSGALASLEAQFGAPLFEMTPIGNRLTTPAVRLRDYASWLVMEAEQAFLDLHAGRIGSTGQVSVLMHGIPRGSVADWAAMKGALCSVSHSGARASFVVSDSHATECGRGENIVLRYLLAQSGTVVSSDHAFRAEDSWRLLALRDEAKTDSPVEWRKLAEFRLIVPPIVNGLQEALAQLPDSLALEIAAFDPAGAPYTILSRKDAALLVPASCLPAGYSPLGLKILSIRGAPLVPVLEMERPVIEKLGEGELARSIRDEITRAAKTGDCGQGHLLSLDAHVDLHTFRCFAATFETGNTSLAAKACFIVQPALSGQVRKLERSLSHQLFVRSHVGMTPTPAGRRLYGLISPVLNDHKTAMERIRDRRWSGGANGRVRLGIIPAANENSLIAEASSDALASWRVQFPDTQISVAEGYTGVLIRWLRTHLIDLAIIDTTENQPGLQVMPIFRESITLVFAPGSSWDTGEDEISGTEISGRRLALASQRFGLRALVDKAFAAANVTVAPDLEVDSMAIALQLVRTAGWATILPASAVHRQLSEGLLKRQLLVEPRIERRICVAIRSHSSISPEANVLLNKIDASFRTRSASGDIEFHDDEASLLRSLKLQAAP